MFFSYEYWIFGGVIILIVWYIFLRRDTTRYKNGVFSGCFDALPKTVPNEIRVFLSSTFEDFQLERNYLIEYVYEKLRDYCRNKYDKEFLLIDMNWGINDGIIEHQIKTRICLDEIEKCQTRSIGPSFVALLSHKYGDSLLKPVIDESEFKIISNEASKIKYKHAEDLLRFCYDLDENELSNRRTYNLKSNIEIFECFKIDYEEWMKVQGMLLVEIRKSVEKNFSNKKLSKTQRDSYFVSAVGDQVEKGILNEKSANITSLAFFRTLKNIPVINDDSQIIRNYIDMDPEMKKLLEDVKRKIEKKLSHYNVHHLEVDWQQSDNFMLPCTQEVSEYLDKFGELFEHSIKSLVDVNMGRAFSIEKRIEYDYDILLEVIHHAFLCKMLNKSFHKRSNLIKRIKLYLNDKKNNKPFVICGSSGSGKSSLIAYTSKYLKSRNDILFVRFMGTTRYSSNIKMIMTTITEQLSILFPTLKFNNEIYKSENGYELRENFKWNLNQILKINANQRLIIMLDSIDQLTTHDQGLDWMLYDLPENVKILFSIDSDHDDVIYRIKDYLEEYESKNFLNIEPLSIQEAMEMFNQLMKINNRKLTSIQQLELDYTINHSDLLYPLHVKLLYDIASKWTSKHQVDSEFRLNTTAEETIKYLFTTYEKYFGEILFSRCMFYLTIFNYNGISESELVDILSIDDDVLNVIFEDEHPSIRKFPIFLWLNIKYYLKDYIISKETDNLTTISWYHRAFIEATQAHYKHMFNPSELKDRILKNVIDYFSEKWNRLKSDGTSGKKKAFEFGKKKLDSFDIANNGNDCEYLAYRNTRIFGNSNYDYRKLNELLNVICMMQDTIKKVKLLKKHVYFNYEFIKAKAELKQLDFVVNMHQSIVRLCATLKNGTSIDLNELVKVSEIYKERYENIQENVDLLNIEVLSRISSRSKYVERFAHANGLILQKSYKSDDREKVIFRTNKRAKNAKIINIYSQTNGPHLFVQVEFGNRNSPFELGRQKIYIINLATKIVIGSLSYRVPTQSLKIILNDDKSDNYARLIDINGFIYMHTCNEVYLMRFDNTFSRLVQYRNGEIKELLLVNSNNLLVRCKRSLSVINLKAGKMIELIKDAEILFMESTIPNHKVYTSSYLDSFDYVIVVVGLENMVDNETEQLLRVYRFNTKLQTVSLHCEIESIEWTNKFVYQSGLREMDEINALWSQSLIINDTFLVDSVFTQPKDVLLEFTVNGYNESNVNHEVVMVIQIDFKGGYSIIDELDGKTIGLRNSYHNSTKFYEKLQVDRFFNRTVLLKRFTICKHNSSDKKIQYSGLYFYNLDTKFSEEILSESWNRIDAISEGQLIVAQKGESLSLLKIVNNKQKVIFMNENVSTKEHVKCYNNFKTDFLFKSDKLYRINPENRETIVEINCNSTDSEQQHCLKVENILSVLDQKHILVEIHEILSNKKTGIEVTIIDVTNQTKQTNYVIDKDCVVNILGSTKDYIVFTTKKNTVQILNVLKIEKTENQFKFCEIFKKTIDPEVCSTEKHLDKCFILMDVIFVLSLNKSKNHIQVNIIDCQDQLNDNARTVNFDFKDLKFDNLESIDCNITSLSNYLVIWQYGKNTIWYLDLENQQTKDIFELSCSFSRTDLVLSIHETDDLIINCNRGLHYKEFDGPLHCMTIDSNSDIMIDNGYLIVNNREYTIMNLHDLNHLRQRKNLNQYLKDEDLYSNVKLIDLCLSMNGKYLIGRSEENELIVYKICNNTIKQIASLHINDKFYNLKSSEEFVSLLVDKKLLSFKIIDNLKYLY